MGRTFTNLRYKKCWLCSRLIEENKPFYYKRIFGNIIFLCINCGKSVYTPLHICKNYKDYIMKSTLNELKRNEKQKE